MFERFTERARQVVLRAQAHAREIRHAEITTGDLLIGIAGESEGMVACALATFGLTEQRLRNTAERLDPTHGSCPVSAALFTPETERAMELALREALSLGHNYIGTEHLLLALLRVEGPHMTMLAEHDALEELHDEILRQLRGQAQPAEIIEFWAWRPNGPAAKVSAPDALAAAKLYNARYATGSGDRVYVAEHARAFEASTTLEEVAGA